MKFGKWSVRAYIGQGHLTTVARKLARYKLDLVGVQKVRCDTGGIVSEGNCIMFMEKEIKIINWERDLLYIRKEYQLL
jgi:hypothetical protein